MAAAPSKTTTPPADAKKALAAAQAKKALAEAEQALAEAELTRQQVEDSKVEQQITRARLRQAEAEAHIAEIGALDIQRAEERYLAQDAMHHIYQFHGSVNASNVSSCISTLSSWSRRDPGCDITIVFNSPGGSVIDGFALWDFIVSLQNAEHPHHITTVARGMAASMAAVLLQVGDTRVVGSEAYVLIHEIASGTSGKIGDIEDELNFLKKIEKRTADLFVKKSKGKLSARKFKQMQDRKDCWLDSTECLELGLCDEVR